MTKKFRLTAVFLLAAAAVVLSLLLADIAAEEDVSAVAEHMHSHLDKVVAIKSAVIAGYLEQVRAPATWLAEHDAPAGFPAAWAPLEEEMRAYARQAAGAPDLSTAAAAVSGIGQTCGACHTASGFAVSFGYSQPPAENPTSTITQMQRHLWAADRMWAGLIGPSDAAWENGADMLTDIRLTAANLTNDPLKQPKVDQLLQRARELGTRGTQASSTEARTNLYGEFLSLCANCHSLTGGGPGL